MEKTVNMYLVISATFLIRYFQVVFCEVLPTYYFEKNLMIAGRDRNVSPLHSVKQFLRVLPTYYFKKNLVMAGRDREVSRNLLPGPRYPDRKFHLFKKSIKNCLHILIVAPKTQF